MKKTVSIIVLQAMLALGSPLLHAQETAPVDPLSTQPVIVDPAAEESALDPMADPNAEFAAEPQQSTVDSAAEATATTDNPYGLGALWDQGDYIAKATLIILVIMSAVTWYIMFTKLWEQQRLMGQARAASRVWEASSILDGVRNLKDNSAYRSIAEDGLNAVKHHDGRLTDKIDVQEWLTMTIQRSVERINSQLQGGLAFLATVGSTAPFIGLFGTVWGIYHALVAIGVSGQASIDKVAGPVGEALIMTAIGLAVAVPAVLGYNWLIRRNKLAMEQLRFFAGDIHAYLLMGARVASEQPATYAAQAAKARAQQPGKNA